jgi:hypothetical protein
MDRLMQHQKQLAAEDCQSTTRPLFTSARGPMPFDLTNMSDEAFDGWLRDLGRQATGDGLNDERLVELVGATLREATPEARAQGLVDLANLCYAMADKTLGSRAPSAKCLKTVVNVGQRQ